MEAALEAVQTWFIEHLVETLGGLLVMAIGWIIGQRRAIAKWQRRNFLDRLNVSLNSLSDNRLRIRTILEKSCQEVFLNDVAVKTLQSAALKTTANDSSLPLPDSDYWYYLNSVLNEIAEKFAEGQLRRDLGLSVTSTPFLICLTCESAGELRTRKIRAMLIQKSVLENLPEKQPELESPHHITRWQTLQQLALLWKQNPTRFLEMEVCL